jgi:hypothetical protein
MSCVGCQQLVIEARIRMAGKGIAGQERGPRPTGEKHPRVPMASGDLAARGGSIRDFSALLSRLDKP